MQVSTCGGPRTGVAELSGARLFTGWVVWASHTPGLDGIGPAVGAGCSIEFERNAGEAANR